MEFWVVSVLKFFDVLAWPTTVVILIYLVRDRLQNVFVKHGETEFMLKSSVEEKLNFVEKKQSQKVSIKEKSIVKDTLEEVRKVLAPRERGSNDNGWYRRYSNGSIVQQIRIPAGHLEGRKTFHFPAASFDDDCVQVTIVGADKPLIQKLTGQEITLELQNKNSNEIIINILGASDL